MKQDKLEILSCKLGYWAVMDVIEKPINHILKRLKCVKIVIKMPKEHNLCDDGCFGIPLDCCCYKMDEVCLNCE